MRVFPVPGALSGDYCEGYALAAVVDGRLVALRYLMNIEPGMDHVLIEGQTGVLRWAISEQAAPIVRELQALGSVHIGFCSSWQFVELGV